jgi:DNA repair exonuclease SbcCD ATPase subunit
MEKNPENIEEPIPTLKSQSLVTGITNEWKPNSFINKSVCGDTWHEFYLQDSSEGSLDSNDCKCQMFSKTSKCLFELRYTNLLEKYYKETTALKEKVNDLRNETELAYQEISRLKGQVLTIQQDYTLQIHNIQARHQQKMLRTKNDIEALVQSIEKKLENQVKQKIEDQINNLKNNYESKIENLNAQLKNFEETRADLEDCKQKLSFFQEKWEKMKEIDEKCEKKLEKTEKNEVTSETIAKIREEYEEKIELLKSEYELEIIKLQDDENQEKLEDFTKKVEEAVNNRLQQELQKTIEKYETLLLKTRKANIRKPESKTLFELTSENSNFSSETNEKLETCEKRIKELEAVISSQEKTIQDMSWSLSSSLKKKPQGKLQDNPLKCSAEEP